MTDAAVAAAVADAHRGEWALVLAATVRVTGRLGDAEDAAQEAYARALTAWAADGIPKRPGAWLTTVAHRIALDRMRRSGVAERALPGLDRLTEPPPDPADVARFDEIEYPDDRLRLVFTCCHPALAPETRLALTLRYVCGVSTAATARTLLVSESTMAARLTRARRKIEGAGIPYAVPGERDLPARLDSVLTVVHLVASAGHVAAEGPDLLDDVLADRALDLAAMLRRLLPRHAAVAGLHALLLLTDARRPARVDADGRPVRLEHQDRSRWRHDLVAEGLEALSAARATAEPHRFTVLAEIAAAHDTSPTWEQTDWDAILEAYDRLLERWPSPVVALNRAAAVSYVRGAAAGLADVERLAADPALARYPYLAVTRAELLARTGDIPGARLAFDEAILLTGNAAEADLWRERRAALPPA